MLHRQLLLGLSSALMAMERPVIVVRRPEDTQQVFEGEPVIIILSGYQPAQEIISTEEIKKCFQDYSFQKTYFTSEDCLNRKTPKQFGKDDLCRKMHLKNRRKKRSR